MEVNNAYLSALGAHIRAMRKARGFSQEGFALISKINRNYYGAIERGKKNLTVFMLLRIAETMRCPVVELFTFETEGSHPEK